MNKWTRQVELKKVQISVSEMKSFSYSTILCIFLVQSTASLSISCEFTIEPWPIEALYTCKTSSLTYDGSSQLKFVAGDHLNESYSLNDVQGLWLYQGVEELLYLPDNFDISFPHIKALKFDNTMIEEISSSDLQQFPELRIFMSSYNPITSLPGDLFQFNTNLRQIYIFGLSDPDLNLRHIGEGLISNLYELEIVRFYSHSCIENEFAQTRSDIEELDRKLHVLCPFEAITSTVLMTITGISSTSVIPDTTSESSTYTSTYLSTETVTSTSAMDETTTSGQTRLEFSIICNSMFIFLCIFCNFMS